MSRHRLGGSPFANPFKLGRNADADERAECIACYERWLMMQPALLAGLHTLAGHDLACCAHRCQPLRRAGAAGQRRGVTDILSVGAGALLVIRVQEFNF
jgi:hypothetical protein